MGVWGVVETGYPGRLYKSSWVVFEVNLGLFSWRIPYTTGCGERDGPEVHS